MELVRVDVINTYTRFMYSGVGIKPTTRSVNNEKSEYLITKTGFPDVQISYQS